MAAPVQPRRSLVRRALRFLIGLAILGLICAPLPIALSQLSGIGHRWTDILAQFTGPAAAAAVLLTVGLLLIRKWRWAVAAAFVAGLTVLAAWPQWATPDGAPEPGAATVTLYSANVYVRNRDVEAMRRSIVEADPDIVILIELGREPSSRLDELLDGYPHRVTGALIDRPTGAVRSVIASRYPLTDLRPDGGPLHMIGARARTPLGPVNVLGVHLTRPWPFQYQWGQIIQTMRLAEVRNSLDGPVIVAGDFNSVSNARIGRQVKAEAGLSPASGFPGTWPSALPGVFGMTIDQVWRSPELAFVSRRLGRRNGSDHRPVVTVITRSASPAAPTARRGPSRGNPPRSTPPRTP